jgi:hypothetical protein
MDIRAGRQGARLTFVPRHSPRGLKCRSRFGDLSVIAGLDPAIHPLAKNDGYAGQARV